MARAQTQARTRGGAFFAGTRSGGCCRCAGHSHSWHCRLLSNQVRKCCQLHGQPSPARSSPSGRAQEHRFWAYAPLAAAARSLSPTLRGLLGFGAGPPPSEEELVAGCNHPLTLEGVSILYSIGIERVCVSRITALDRPIGGWRTSTTAGTLGGRLNRWRRTERGRAGRGGAGRGLTSRSITGTETTNRRLTILRGRLTRTSDGYGRRGRLGAH